MNRDRATAHADYLLTLERTRRAPDRLDPRFVALVRDLLAPAYRPATERRPETPGPDRDPAKTCEECGRSTDPDSESKGARCLRDGLCQTCDQRVRRGRCEHARDRRFCQAIMRDVMT